MIKAEVNEIKKLYHIKNCSVRRISGCYVSGEKEIIARWSKNFLAMDEEDLYKYLAIFQKCLSGKLDKTLFNVKTGPRAMERMQELTECDLKDEDVLTTFYESIIDTFEYVGNYLILVVHDIYDVPGKGTDNMEMEDASDTVYDYILACICPAVLSTPNLGYDREKEIFTHVERDWILKAPEAAVLYPAFNNREADEESALYFVKSMDSTKKEFAERFMETTIDMTPKEEKDIFDQIIEDVLGYDKSIRDVSAVAGEVRKLAEEKKSTADEEDKYKIGVEDIREVLDAAGIRRERINRLDKIFLEAAGSLDAKVSLENVVNRRSFTIKTESGNINTKPHNAGRVYQKVLDGVPCLVMELTGDDMEVAGITVNISKEGVADD